MRDLEYYNPEALSSPKMYDCPSNVRNDDNLEWHDHARLI
ncbi:hypothetical protein PLUTE_a1676 [Pseudoalteromonas luteoviolacea DSM 6061]|nr:hypothetical protein [Pseudoalteromonas luteoviolacea DSM 6061]